MGGKLADVPVHIGIFGRADQYIIMGLSINLKVLLKLILNMCPSVWYKYCSSSVLDTVGSQLHPSDVPYECDDRNTLLHGSDPRVPARFLPRCRLHSILHRPPMCHHHLLLPSSASRFASVAWPVSRARRLRRTSSGLRSVSSVC